VSGFQLPLLPPPHFSYTRAHIGKIVAESKYASNVTGFTALIKANDTVGIRSLVTNTTQETGVLNQATASAAAFSDAWLKSGALVTDTFASNLQNATATLFRELIDITTEIEIEYVSRNFMSFYAQLLLTQAVLQLLQRFR
jgi:chorismate mutase